MFQPAVFLDRDGVLNIENGHITSRENLEVYTFARDCIRRLHDAGFFVIVVSNQSGVARGLYSENELLAIHDKLKEETGVDAIYYCPHYPEGIIAKYRKDCNCRKPKTGMIDLACKKHNIDLTQSFIVGDRASDIQTGINSGLKTILVRTGYGVEDEDKVNADYTCDDLRDAVEICVSNQAERDKP